MFVRFLEAELFLAVHQVIYPFANSNIDEKKTFPNATRFDKYTCAKLYQKYLELKAQFFPYRILHKQFLNICKASNNILK